MNSDLIKAKVRLELAKHYDFTKNLVKSFEAEDGITKLVTKEIESEIQKLQSKVHDLVGDGEVMMLFNEILGIGAGA